MTQDFTIPREHRNNHTAEESPDLLGKWGDMVQAKRRGIDHQKFDAAAQQALEAKDCAVGLGLPEHLVETAQAIALGTYIASSPPCGQISRD